MPLELGARYKRADGTMGFIPLESARTADGTLLNNQAVPVNNVPPSQRPQPEEPLGLPVYSPDDDAGSQAAPTANKPTDRPAAGGETPLGLPTWKF